ncbi:N/A [soil metagenome]
MKNNFLLVSIFLLFGSISGYCTELIHVSDIHFDPYNDSTLVPMILHSPPESWKDIFESSNKKDIGNYGSETNYYLLKDLLSGIKKNSPDSRFIMITGDILVHSFIDTYKKYSGTDYKDSISLFAFRTIKFVTLQMRNAFPESKIIFALGNNDSNIGNYSVDTGGDYLAMVYDHIKALNKDQKILFKNDSESYRRGGYFSVRLNDKKRVRLILLNTVIFSSYFKDSALDTNSTEGLKELNWLEGELRSASKKKEKVWIAYHIAPGVDVYKTVKSTACDVNKIVTLWKDNFTDKFLAIEKKYRNVIAGNFAGHFHMDDLKLIMDNGKPAAFIKLAPAISPVYLNNPGFCVYDYNENNGLLNNYTVYFRDLVSRSSEWQLEYSFKEKFNLTPTILGFNTYKDLISENEEVRKSYIDFYSVSNMGVSMLMLPGYKPFQIGISNLTRQDFYNANCVK